MKAIVYREYGGSEVLRCEDVERPTAADNQVLIEVRAASINPLDWRLMNGRPVLLRIMQGLPNPKFGRPGRDVAGLVEAVGKKVTQFKPGDAVFGTCLGALAEYAVTSEAALVAKPDALTFEQAAAVPVAAYTALQGLRDKGHLQPGQEVLINGASGGVGTFAVQIAKSFGAEVTGVCSTRNIDLVRSLGADRVIDYTREDFTRDTHRYDLILDCVGNQPVSACRRVLNPKGMCVIAGAPKEFSTLMMRVVSASLLSRFVSQSFVLFIARQSQADLTTMNELMVARKVTPIIDKRYRLDEAPEAIRYLEAGHARGKVVITMGT